MRMADLLRLGTANIAAQKRQNFKVVIIVGILFSVIIAAILLLQGGQNVRYDEINRATKGQVLVRTKIDSYVCEHEQCDRGAWLAEAKANIEKYGGEVLPMQAYSVAGTTFYALPAEIFAVEETLPQDTVPVVLPINMAAVLAGIELPTTSYYATNAEAVAENVELVQKIYREVKGKIVMLPGSNVKYYILDLAPSNMSFNMNNSEVIGLNALLSIALRTGSSSLLPLIARDVETNLSMLVPVETPGEIWAAFPSMQTAANYAHDPLNECSVFQQDTNTCPAAHRYRVMDTFGEGFGTGVIDEEHYYQMIWQILDVATVVLVVIAIIVMASTYTRVLAQNTKVVSLYHTMGATKSDIRKIYCVYLVCISLLASGFALAVGLLLVLAINLTSATALTQTLALNLGSLKHAVWVIGWNWRVLIIFLVPLLVAPLTILLNNGAFGAKKVARKLK